MTLIELVKFRYMIDDHRVNSCTPRHRNYRSPLPRMSGQDTPWRDVHRQPAVRNFITADRWIRHYPLVSATTELSRVLCRFLLRERIT